MLFGKYKGPWDGERMAKEEKGIVRMEEVDGVFLPGDKAAQTCTK